MENERMGMYVLGIESRASMSETENISTNNEQKNEFKVKGECERLCVGVRGT